VAPDFGQLLTIEAGAQMWRYIVSIYPPDVSAE